MKGKWVKRVTLFKSLRKVINQNTQNSMNVFGKIIRTSFAIVGVALGAWLGMSSVKDGIEVWKGETPAAGE